MIVDTSAIIAILRDEPDAREIASALELADVRRISAATYVETGIVTDSNRNALLSNLLDSFLGRSLISIEPVTVQQARIAREAYRDFGKGRHRAGLNLGDCFAYALAKDRGEPLLFKGDNFRRTDVEPAEY
jgi:ribonuclease VapC